MADKIYVVCDSAGRPAAAYLDWNRSQLDPTLRAWGCTKVVREQPAGSGCRAGGVHYPRHDAQTRQGTCARCGAVLDAEAAVRSLSAADIMERDGR